MVKDIVFELYTKLEIQKNEISSIETKNKFENRVQRQKLSQNLFLEFENDQNSFSGQPFDFFFVELKRVLGRFGRLNVTGTFLNILS